MIGYMCKTDFDYHLTGDSRGTLVYACREDLEKDRECVKQCGIVEVEVKLMKVAQEENFDDVVFSANPAPPTSSTPPQQSPEPPAPPSASGPSDPAKGP